MKLLSIKSLKSILLKNILEFIVIVLGITFSFYLEDNRKSEELKTLSTDLKQNLLNEIFEIEKYMIEREVAFKGDQKLLRSLQDPTISFDSLFSIESKPVMYGAALFNYRGFKPPVAFYNSLVNDGKIRYLESSIVKEELDKMHTTSYYYVDTNVKDETVAQRKIMDYFQIHYPLLFIESNDWYPNKNYSNKLKLTIDNDINLRSILYQKSLAIEQKVVGFYRYKTSLEKIKNILVEDLE